MMTTTDFKAFFEANEPDDAAQLAALYRSVSNIDGEDFFRTEEVSGHGKVTHRVVASSGDVLLLTAKSYLAFIAYIESQNTDPDFDIEEAADFEYAINNPHS